MCITHSHKKTAQFILIVLLVAIFALPALTCAQTSALTTREALIRAIEAHAQQDVELERPRARALDLETLIGEEASAVGLTMAEVQTIYDRAYSAATSEKPWWESLQPKEPVGRVRG